jgi:tryptophanyl-tRNA synthetase
MGTRKKRILTGDRTTGRLHLGHYVGSLRNRVRLQHELETFILLADVQALTTHFENPGLIRDSIIEVAIDNLSVGLDPELFTIVQQSQVPAISELTVFYSMLVTVNVLRHNPTIKTEATQYGYDDMTYGFLGYPVSQAADITFCDADLVPVGEDQVPHIELTRKIARRFNDLYGAGEPVIRVPAALVGETPRLAGLDGNAKMGKSLGNAIYLSDDAPSVAEKVRNAVTDKNRIKVADKGNPDICNVSEYHKAFNAAEYENVCEMCRSAAIGCVACKKNLAATLNSMLDPIRENRANLEANKGFVRDFIAAGTEKANRIGNETVARAKRAMGIEL